MLDNVKDGQQGPREAQQLTEVVETEVHQVSGKIHHLIDILHNNKDFRKERYRKGTGIML